MMMYDAFNHYTICLRRPTSACDMQTLASRMTCHCTPTQPRNKHTYDP